MSIKSHFNNFLLYLKNNPKFLYRFGLIFIVLSVLVLYISGPYLSDIQQRKQTTGFSFNMAKEFIYFYFHTGYFPLSTLEKIEHNQHNKKYAYFIINHKGKSLTMEYLHWSRMGENARIFAFLPDALISGTSKPTIKLFNTIVFLISMLLLFHTFYKYNQPITGFIICFLLLATPFYQYAVFRQKNIFALIASVYLIVTAINARFIFSNKQGRWNIFLPLISGAIIGFFAEIRGEIIVLMASVILYYLFAFKQKYATRGIYIIPLIIAFYSVRNGIRNYFEIQFDKTTQLVIEKGGHPYNGKRAEAHSFWHPVFCGLGDFDKNYGYEWNDTVAYSYAIPILKEKYNINLPYSGKYHFDAYYDKDSLYYIKFEELPVYEDIIRHKVLTDIKNNPLWFLTIILKRIVRILSNSLPFPLAGWLIIPLIIILIRKKENRLLVFLISSFPLSFTPLFIYSGGNSTFNSIFPIIALAIFICILFFKAIKVNESAISK